MHTLVISGGGSKGAFAGGVAEYLIRECRTEYDLFVGSSTGSLLISHLALGKVDEIKKVFTSVRQKDIFNVSPFKITKTDQGPDIKINHFNTLRTFLFGEKTFGESRNLRKLLFKTLSRAEFLELKRLKKEVVVSVSNLTKYRTEFKSSSDCNYVDFVDWMWASANYVPFMSLLTKNGMEYADGGFGTHTPVQAAIDHGATSIDIIVLEPEPSKINRQISPSINAFSSLMKVFGFMTDQIFYDDMTIGRLKSRVNDVEVRFFHTPRVLTEFPLFFSPKQMANWWEEGYEHAKKVNPYCTIIGKSNS